MNTKMVSNESGFEDHIRPDEIEDLIQNESQDHIQRLFTLLMKPSTASSIFPFKSKVKTA